MHACIYFIPPTGHALREMDIELMRKLSSRVNVIPVIGRSDSLTPTELKTFKKRVMEDIEHYQIPIFNFPYDVEEVSRFSTRFCCIFKSDSPAITG